MAVAKKGVFFTILSIILVASLIFFYISSNRYSMEDKQAVIETRVLTMNSFISDVEKDIWRGMYISSIRSLIGMLEYMTENGTYLENFTSSFNEVMLNGTINGKIINITTDSNFGDWIEKISALGQRLDINVSFQNLSVTPYHENPWSVVIRVDGIMNLTDNKGIASWERSINITANIDIIEFEDPIYTVTSAGKFTNKIIKSNITDFVNNTNASNLILHANNSWYIASTLAPSFLMRFAGNFSSSPYGIESIVNVPELQIAAPELYHSGSSSVDYIYFDNYSISSCQVNETRVELDWFRLDNEHLSVYEAHCES